MISSGHIMWTFHFILVFATNQLHVMLLYEFFLQQQEQNWKWCTVEILLDIYLDLPLFFSHITLLMNFWKQKQQKKTLYFLISARNYIFSKKKMLIICTQLRLGWLMPILLFVYIMFKNIYCEKDILWQTLAHLWRQIQ